MRHDDDFFTWIERHKGESPAALLLKYGHDRDDEILQIECRGRFGSKVGSALRDAPEFIFPTRLSGEQCTSERLARLHANLVPHGSTMADLTAGLGIDAMYIARHCATQVTAVEIDPVVADALRHNSRSIPGFEVVNANCAKWLQEAADNDLHYDCIFIDPARRADDGGRIYAIDQCRPDVIELLPLIRRITSRLIIKASPMLDITHTARALPEATEIIVTGTTTECKEIVAVCDFNAVPPDNYDNVPVRALTVLNDDSVSEFTFTRRNEAHADAPTGLPEVGHYIFDPYPAVMKAGAFRLLAERFGLSRFDANTQLWWGVTANDKFPGTVHRIIDIREYSSKNIKRYKSQYPHASVTTRNFGIKADEVRRRLGVTDGRGDIRLFAVGTPSSRLLITTNILSATVGVPKLT